jgi:hypothetical protein
MQLTQLYSKKSRSTTLPRKSASLAGAEFSHGSPPLRRMKRSVRSQADSPQTTPRTIVFGKRACIQHPTASDVSFAMADRKAS